MTGGTPPKEGGRWEVTVDETGMVTDALRRVRRASGVSLAFAGTVAPAIGRQASSLVLEHFVGNTRGVLAGVSVALGHGLGGKVLSVNRPVVVDDYLRTPHITHRYNTIIASEGLRAMVAAPVVVDRAAVAVLYGALHTEDPIGDRTFDVLAEEARALEHQIVVERATAERAAGRDPIVGALRDRLTEAYGRLRVLEHATTDTEMIRQIEEISGLLLDGAGEPGPDEPAVALTRREGDVLSLAAIGYSNARIAETLGISVQTAKGYMRDAMCKLGAATRLEAVVIARRTGLLPA